MRRISLLSCGFLSGFARGARAGDSLRGHLAKLPQFAQFTPRSGFFGVIAPNAEARRKYNGITKRTLMLQSASFFTERNRQPVFRTACFRMLSALRQPYPEGIARGGLPARRELPAGAPRPKGNGGVHCPPRILRGHHKGRERCAASGLFSPLP